jgi:hypothetical protein
MIDLSLLVSLKGREALSKFVFDGKFIEEAGFSLNAIVPKAERWNPSLAMLQVPKLT